MPKTKTPKQKKPLITYVALLRGVNVGGNALVQMSELKISFEEMGLFNVRTYINSGNVIFQSAKTDQRRLEKDIESKLRSEYHFSPRVILKKQDEMESIYRAIPKGWGTGPERKYNVLYLKRNIDSKDILNGLNPKKGIEEVTYHPGVLFWSALTSDLSKTTMVKLSSQKMYQEITVRNLNTTRKIFELMTEKE